MIRSQMEKVLVLENGSTASYPLTVDSIISVNNDQSIKQETLLQGCQRIEQN